MPSKWIGRIHEAQVRTRWSPRERSHSYDPEDKSGNAGRREYDMLSHVEFWMEPTKDEWPSSVQQVRLPSVSTGAR